METSEAGRPGGGLASWLEAGWLAGWLGWPLHEEMQVTSTALSDVFPCSLDGRDMVQEHQSVVFQPLPDGDFMILSWVLHHSDTFLSLQLITCWPTD